MNKLKLSTLLSNKPVFHFFGREYELAGCGATALSFITGDNPYVIKYENKEKNDSHFSDKFMVDFLKKRDFTIERITDPKLFKGKKRTTAFDEKVTDSHVLLCCIKLGKGFSSWCVIFQGKYLVHNFQLVTMKPIDFLNWPLHDESRYIISHPNWK
jgi:hypothetical protein